MSVLANLLSKEETRNETMINEYNNELNMLPKGSIKKKNINGKEYFYLIFRDGKKVVTKYIGKDQKSVFHVQEQLERRKQIIMILKKLNDEKRKIRKMEDIL